MIRPAPRSTRSRSHCLTACGTSVTTCSISGSDALQPGLDLDYPHDYPHDYLPTARNASVVNDAVSPMPFELVVYGPVSQPAIIIGVNRYELHMDIPSGSYVTVNSVEGQRSIVMTAENGDTTNVFDKGERGSGINGGTYMFQPLPAGEHQVQWNGFRL